MNAKLLSIISVSVAILSASIAAVVVHVKRADVARSLAAKAEAETEKAEKDLRKAEKEKAAADAKERTAKANAAAKADERKAKEAESVTARENAKAAADSATAARETAKAAQLASEKARAERDAEAEKAKAAREVAREATRKAELEAAKAADEAKARADTLENTKRKTDGVIAEAKLLELRKIDFETIELNLKEWKQDLEERERALQPEKTITDLAWAGGTEDTIIDASNNVVKVTKKPYLAEEDRTLPKAARMLAKRERLNAEADKVRSDKVRESIVKPLEELYVQALKDDRVTDADYYRKTLKTLYPDWEFSTINSTEKEKQK